MRDMPCNGFRVIICAIIVSYFAPFVSGAQQIPQQVLYWQKAAQSSLVQGNAAAAVENYRKIIQVDPDASYATEAQRQIVQTYVQSGQKDQAKAALAELKQKYASRPEYVKQVHEVAWEFVQKGDYATAIQVYTDLQKQFPNHERAVWFQRSIVQTYLEQGDIDKVKQAVEDLKNNFQSCPDYANQMTTTADRLRGKKQYKIAGEIYDTLLKQQSENKQAAAWRRMQIQNALDSGQTETAKANVETLFSTYSDKPEFVKQAHELGWEFVQKQDYATGLRIYKGLLEQFPNHERAAWFQRSIVQTYLEQGDTTKALQAVESLKNNFQSSPDYANQMEALVGILVDKNQPAAAKGVCDTLLEKFPNHSRLPWFLQAKARSEAWMKRRDMADATVQVMQQKCGSDPNFADAMSWTAYEYRRAGYYERAIELYESLLSQNPGPKVQIRSIASIAQAYVRLGNDAKVQEKVDYLLLHFKQTNPEGVAFYMFGVGEEYYNKAFTDNTYAHLTDDAPAMLNKAIEIWQKPAYPENSKQKIDAAYFTATAYMRLRQYETAIEWYKKMVATWPKYEHCGNALLLTGICYASMAENGNKNAEEALAGANAAWQAVIDKYPESLMAYDAAIRLARSKEREGHWEDAAKAYAFFLAYCGKDPRKAQTIFKLGRAYEHAGQKETAIAAYREYVQLAPAGDESIARATEALRRLEKN